MEGKISKMRSVCWRQSLRKTAARHVGSFLVERETMCLSWVYRDETSVLGVSGEGDGVQHSQHPRLKQEISNLRRI